MHRAVVRLADFNMSCNSREILKVVGQYVVEKDGTETQPNQTVPVLLLQPKPHMPFPPSQCQILAAPQ